MGTALARELIDSFARGELCVSSKDDDNQQSVEGDTRDATAPDVLKAVLVEFIAVFLFVFIGLGSLTVTIAITVAATANISGGHVNPAVTIGLVIGGNVTLVTGILYWIGQLLGSIAAALILKFILVSTEPVPNHALADGVTIVGGLVMEIILSIRLGVRRVCH
ncbi:unnamed protein product [Calypogeia fissa]